MHTKKNIIRRTVPTVSTETLSHLPSLLRRIYQARGVTHKDELEHSLKHLLNYNTLTDMDKAVQLLSNALRKQDTILVVGDFDADGATSTAVCIRALKLFGAQHVHYLVPNRFQFGYGLTEELIEHEALRFNPKLIVTVDNGIANHAGVLAAKKHGISVLITDHHLPGSTRPEADAIVNPNQHNDPFPSKCLAGVGVIFYVMLALRRHLLDLQWFSKKNLPAPNLAGLLDIVALGTVADLVPLDQNNRILVHHGIERIKHGQCCAGIAALFEISKRPLHHASASDIGFQIASRLNAAGRLDDMSLGIECLLTDDPIYARQCAHALDQFNQERKAIENEMQIDAIDHLIEKHSEKSLPTGLCVHHETWHQGVIGILASRLKERFHRPVIALAPGQDDEYKGSGRSIPKLHLRDVLAEIACTDPDLLIKFGGHAMAAGLTLHKKNIQRFQMVFDETVKKYLSENDLNANILSDGELSEEELSLDTARLLKTSGPWGQAFPEPVFDDVFDILEQRIVGEKHLKLKLKKQNVVVDGIWFFADTKEWPNLNVQKAHMAYRLDINEYQHRESVQLMVQYISAY